MDFQIYTQANFESQASQFLQFLLGRGYSNSTIDGYQSYLKRLKKHFFSLPEQIYNEKSSQIFIENVLPTLKVSESTKKHIRTTVRHFNDYLSNRPYRFRINKGAQLPPLIFQNIIDDYVSEMAVHGYKPATIEVRKIYAIQFLVSVYKQGIHSLKEVSGTHVGCSILSSSSVEGMCQKLPHFLKYLHKKGLMDLELQYTVPSVIPEKKLPSVYDKQELIHILSGIDTTALIGKRDYAILVIFMTYGLRVKDLIELKTENIDFQHGYISFKQSKTGKPYCAELLQVVKESLESYLSVVNPLLENRKLFYSTQAPYQPLSRSAIWSVVSGRIHSTVVVDGRHQGSHAIRSSLASGLIADNVPYPIVQKILGHTDPNATKRYVAIDIEQLRNTVRSYTYTFQLLFVFLKETRAIPPEKVNFNALDQDTIEAFLVWIEKTRGCCINTRNHKLSGLSAFAKYAVNREPAIAAGFYSAVTGIPKKKSEKTIPVYFTKEEIEVLLHIPSGSKRIEIRNRTLLSVLYATGARAQELCDIQVSDIHFGDKTSIKLIGKGKKARKITIPAKCAALLKDYLISENKLTALESHAFSSQTNEHMTISCVEEIVKKYVRLAKQENPLLFREKNYAPHSFRHSIAVHMLEAGIPLPVIKNFLGHSSIEVTMIYATVSDEIKNKYLKENGILATLMKEEKKESPKCSYPGMDFLNRI